MATLGVTNMTLLDWAKMLDPDGSVATAIEILNLYNPILDDMPFIEGNLPTGHRHTIRTGLPTVTWRKLYGYVLPSKSQRAQVTDTCGMLEAYSDLDKDLAELNGNTMAARMSEDAGFLEAMSQEMASSLFYASEASAPEEITGLSPRYNSLSAENGGNVLKSGTTPDVSMWLIDWGPRSVFGMFPKGSKAGFTPTDKGLQTVQDTVGGTAGRREAYVTHYQWKLGLALADWRRAVRMQFDISEVTASASTGPDLLDLLTQGIHRMPGSRFIGRPVIYCNSTTFGWLDRQSRKQSTLGLTTIQGADGMVKDTFRGIPIKQCDALLASGETEVS